MTFYLLLFVPFAFFFERVFLRHKDTKRGFLLRTLIFGLTLVLSYIIRRDNDAILYLKCFAYGIIGLLLISTPLGSMLIIPFRRFERWLKTRFDNPSRFEVNVSRLSAISSAFSLGLSNTNKRRVQTTLTCLTLILLSFCVLSFTSIKTMLIYRKTDVGRLKAEYQGSHGITVRGIANSPMFGKTYEDFLKTVEPAVLKDMTTARSIYKPSEFELLDGDMEEMRASYMGKSFNIDAFLGLTAKEIQLSRMENILIDGTWFQRDDANSVIIPANLSMILDISSEDLGRAHIKLGDSQEFLVIGIYDPGILLSMRDMDGMPTFDTVTGGALILPYDKVMEMGGAPTLFLLKSDGKQDIISLLERIVEVFPYMIYRMDEGRIYQYRPVRALATEGIENLPILMIVVGLVILNTMLSSVYQRQDEIFIYGSVGLSPLHIGGLFIAEAMVYAVIGCTAGYILGGLTARIISRYELIPGLVMDYSSFAVMRSVILIINLVLISTIYPAVAASRLSVPNIERRWRMPRSFKDELTLTLPFIFSGGEPVGVLAFLKRFFENAGEKDSQFGYAFETHVKSDKTRYGRSYTLEMKVHLAPYDLGINQLVRITTVPTNVAGVHQLDVHLVRLTGDVPSWNRGNQSFISTLRKQCLVWRSLSPKVKADHEEMGLQLFSEISADAREKKEQHKRLQPQGSRA